MAALLCSGATTKSRREPQCLGCSERGRALDDSVRAGRFLQRGAPAAAGPRATLKSVSAGCVHTVAAAMSARAQHHGHVMQRLTRRTPLARHTKASIACAVGAHNRRCTFPTLHVPGTKDARLPANSGRPGVLVVAHSASRLALWRAALGSIRLAGENERVERQSGQTVAHMRACGRACGASGAEARALQSLVFNGYGPQRSASKVETKSRGAIGWAQGAASQVLPW